MRWKSECWEKKERNETVSGGKADRRREMVVATKVER